LTATAAGSEADQRADRPWHGFLRDPASRASRLGLEEGPDPVRNALEKAIGNRAYLDVTVRAALHPHRPASLLEAAVDASAPVV
jgi:hypothetical protein